MSLMFFMKAFYSTFRSDLAISGLKKLSDRFKNSSEIGRVYIAHIEHLLSLERTDEARAVCTDVIAGCVEYLNFGMDWKSDYVYKCW